MAFVFTFGEQGEESLSDWPGRRGMMLKTTNKTVKIRTTTIANGDIGFSFLYNSIYLYVVRKLLVSSALYNPYGLETLL